jgi:hypothetical protein
MRWFTRELYQGGDADNAWSAALAQYEAHLIDLLPRLPQSLRDLAMLSLHDGRFTECTLAAHVALVTLRLVGGDDRQSYVEVAIRYDQASIVGASPTDVAGWMEDRLTEVLYDELDLDDGTYQHRYLLWPQGEFAVHFADARIAVTPSSSEQYESAKAQVEIIR